MKTAMQELIDWSYENDKSYCPIEAYDIIKKAKDLLEKEKEQILDAYNQGTLDGESSMLEYPNYYNQTYNQNKETNNLCQLTSIVQDVVIAKEDLTIN